jgi:hypothetical protein
MEFNFQDRPPSNRAIEDAALTLERIDAQWPVIVNSFSAKEPKS